MIVIYINISCFLLFIHYLVSVEKENVALIVELRKKSNKICHLIYDEKENYDREKNLKTIKRRQV